jgi:hypothetical protein
MKIFISIVIFWLVTFSNPGDQLQADRQGGGKLTEETLKKLEQKVRGLYRERTTPDQEYKEGME